MRAFMIVVLSCLMSGIALAVVPANTNDSRSRSQITGSSLGRKQIEQHQRLEGVGSSSFSESRESRRRNGNISSGRADEPLEERLKRLINQSSVMLFMRGNPSQPKCGFSRQVVEMLNDSGVSYKTFDILEDEEVRQGLKDFSQWQTYPQLYVNGSLVGGFDVIRDIKEMGKLEDLLTGKPV